jgi:hypothetical protein
MPMPLDVWDLSVRYHLDLMSAGADMCMRHATRLVARPDFETLTEDDLKACETALRRSLEAVRQAQAIYRAKEVER